MFMVLVVYDRRYVKKFVMNEKTCRNISINETNRLRSHINTNTRGEYASFFYILIWFIRCRTRLAQGIKYDCDANRITELSR